MNIEYKRITSQSRYEGVTYKLTIVEDQVVACTCGAFNHGPENICKHMLAEQQLILNRLQREN